MFETKTVAHYLTSEPTYLTPFELVLSSGFRFYMTLLWVPTIIILILGIKLYKKLK